LVRKNGFCAESCVKREPVYCLALGVGLQIDHADGMGSGLAGVECGSVGLRLHGMAMGHRVRGVIGKLVLHTLRPAYGGRGLGQEQHEQ
jgi:hypothetical protein